jgi:hypothetical protein
LPKHFDSLTTKNGMSSRIDMLRGPSLNPNSAKEFTQANPNSDAPTVLRDELTNTWSEATVVELSTLSTIEGCADRTADAGVIPQMQQLLEQAQAAVQEVRNLGRHFPGHPAYSLWCRRGQVS